jgi:hypothetical protein
MLPMYALRDCECDNASMFVTHTHTATNNLFEVQLSS